MSKKSEVKAVEEVAAPKASTSRIGQPAPWVPGHFPKKWPDFTDAELRPLALTRPEGAEFKSARPEPVEVTVETPAAEQESN